MGVFFFCGLFLSMPRTDAQNTEKPPAWYKSIFIEAGGFAAFPPKLFLGDVKPMFGFQGAIGYEWNRFQFSFSSGYSQSAGIDPLVEDISFIPITGRLGYSLPIKNNWGVEAGLGAGVQLSKTLHYDTALDYLADRKSESMERKQLLEGRMHATYTIPNNFLKIYAGGGADILFETEGPLALPLLEAGISIKPFALYTPKERKPKTPKIKPVKEKKVKAPKIKRVKKTKNPVVKPEEPITLALTEILEPEPEPEILVIEPEPEERIPLEYAIYFEADRGSRVHNRSRALLQEAGRVLQENPESFITLRGFAAPSGTTESQVVISAARVWHCVEYFKRECKIPEDRIQMQFFGSQDKSISKETQWELRRRVEFVIDFSPKDHSAGAPVSKPVPEPGPSTFVPKDTNTGKNANSTRTQYALYFEGDRGTKLLWQSQIKLQEAGRLLRRNPKAHVTLRGYAAPSGTTGGQVAISAARVWHCVEYLKWDCKIPEKQIQMQFFGAEEKPISREAEWQRRRRVELIIDINNKKR
jgi:outer membrane protein OmpA-like peptidoglycan-associated protein